MDKHAPENNKTTTCRNCQAEFKGNYCSNCGQSKKELNRPFSIVLYDFAGTVFAFDTRLLKSLRTLLFAPGMLAKHFVEGKRARYMPPFQMFVFVSFIFFLSLSVFTQRSLNKIYENQKTSDISPVADSQTQNKTNPLDTSDINIVININGDNTFSPVALKKLIDRKIETDTTLTLEEVNILKRTSRMLSNPNVYFATVFKYLSWGSFLLMPVFALLLLAFFNRKGLFYTAHLTFSINLHTFLFLTFLFTLFLKIIFKGIPGLIVLALMLQFLVYELIALRRMYRNSIGKIILKFIAINITYILFFLGITMVIVVVAFLQF